MNQMGFPQKVDCAAKAANEGGGSDGDKGSVEKVGMRHGFLVRENCGERERIAEKVYDEMGVRVFVGKKRDVFLNASKEGGGASEAQPTLPAMSRSSDENYWSV